MKGLSACACGLVFAASLCAQTPALPTAPMPAVLYHTQKIFLGNAGDQTNDNCLRAYKVFYAGLNHLHRFTLVDDPSNADLVVELHYELDLGSTKVSGGNASRQFRAVLLEPHTNTVVWSLTERTNYAVFQKNRDKNLDDTIGALVQDFANTVSDQEPPELKHPSGVVTIR